MYCVHGRRCFVILGLSLILLAACGSSPTARPGLHPAPTDTPPATEVPTVTPIPATTEALPASPTPTETATPPVVGSGPTATQQVSNRCAGTSGELEIRVLAGPGAAVGLEPYAIGQVPFSITTNQAPYLVAGGGPISYGDVLVEKWGTYEVSMDLDFAVEGECLSGVNGEQLDLILEMTGEQMVKVDAGQFQGDYPWSGTTSLPVSLPLEDGASAQGEGWVIVLHLP